MPHCLFTSKTLVRLSVYRIFAGTNTVVHLPTLKKLELKLVKYESEESLAHLVSGCPALEELTIVEENDYFDCLHVSSPTLTRLHLQKNDDNDFDDDNEVYEVKLDTPALEYLSFDDSLSRDFEAGMLASLTEADVVFGKDQPFYSRDVLYPRFVLEFVGKLNNVSCLKLTIGSLKVPDSAFSAAPFATTEFRNLTKLEFVGRWRGDWRFVTYFLENSDNLHVLIIKMAIDLQNWMEPKQVPVCLKCRLGKVRFENFECSEAGYNVVEYILRNAKVLKKMEILCFSRFNRDLKKKSEALQRVSLFERASEACQLAFD